MNWDFVVDVFAVMGGGIAVVSVGKAVLRMWSTSQLKKMGYPIDPHVCISCLPIEALTGLFERLETKDDKYLFLCWVNHYRPSVMTEKFVHEFAKTYPERFQAKK